LSFFDSLACGLVVLEGSIEGPRDEMAYRELVRYRAMATSVGFEGKYGAGPATM
jgi:hypothetical protein